MLAFCCNGREQSVITRIRQATYKAFQTRHLGSVFLTYDLNVHGKAILVCELRDVQLNISRFLADAIAQHIQFSADSTILKVVRPRHENVLRSYVANFCILIQVIY